jgi:hypothetical protein
MADKREGQGYSVGAARGAAAKGAAGKPAADPGGRSPLMLVGGAFVVLAAVAIGVGFFGLGIFDSTPDFASAAKSAGCVVQDFKHDPGGTHLKPGDPAPKYDSDPPTHGQHDPVPALWGIYDSPVDETKLVHNLEHAGLVVQYGPKVPADQVAALRAAIDRSHDFTVLAPYPALGDKIAFAVWTHLAKCSSFSGDVLAHYQGYRNKPGGSDESANARSWANEPRLPGY